MHADAPDTLVSTQARTLLLPGGAAAAAAAGCRRRRGGGRRAGEEVRVEGVEQRDEELVRVLLLVPRQVLPRRVGPHGL